MRTLHLYLLRQILATLLMTVAVFTFVLLLGNVLKEILVLLINRQATVGGVLEVLALLVPFVLMFALPMGMLTAVLLFFGRFSADQELTAVRSSGISLISLISPILILSLLLCGLSAWINMEVAPRCRVASKHLFFEMSKQMTGSLLPEGRYTTIGDFDIYVGSGDGHEFRNVWLQQHTAKGELKVITAESGQLDMSNTPPLLIVFKPKILDEDTNGNVVIGQNSQLKIPLNLKMTERAEDKPSITDLTFTQLQEELRKMEARPALAIPKDLPADEQAKWKLDLTMPLRVQLHRQVAISFACFGFTLVGIPLGIRAHRRETNAGIAMALGLVFVYYSFIIIAQSLQTRAEFAPHLIIWIPNLLFQAVGTVMLWRANRGI